MLLKQGLLFADRYQLSCLLGRGGFSEVWLAKDNWTHLDIAIKVYAPGHGMDADGLQEFCGELANVFDLNHTNLLKPTHVDKWNDMPYLIMPYCPHGSLSDKKGKLSEKDIWKLIHDVASGLAYLHSKDVVHQDISPDNILIDDSGNYLITDFGISTRARSTLRKSVIKGTSDGGKMAYMGPERFSQQPAPIKASDIWSLGAMLYELIEGNVPFGEIGGGMQKGGAEIPLITADISKELKSAIYKMLSKETWDRPTAEILIEWVQDPTRINGDEHGRTAGNGWLVACALFVIVAVSSFFVMYLRPIISPEKSKYLHTDTMRIVPSQQHTDTLDRDSAIIINNKVPKEENQVPPQLSVDKKNISVSAESGSITIKVTSNRPWEIDRTYSTLFKQISKKTDNQIFVKYAANPDTIVREDYFDVKMVDGSKSVRVKVIQSAKTYLILNKTSFAVPSKGGTYNVSVLSNDTWSYTASNNMFVVKKINGNLFITVNKNGNEFLRRRSVTVKTTDGTNEHEISFCQAANSIDSTAYAHIYQVWLEHDIRENDQLGMRIHTKMGLYNLKDKECRLSAYFSTKAGEKLKDTNNSYRTTNGNVSCGKSFIPSYSEYTEDDFVMFMPYSELHIKEKGEIKVNIQLWNNSVTPSACLGDSPNYVYFSYAP